MQSTPEIIELLNEVLTAELTAINQYFVHAKMQDNWGYKRLAEKGREESFGEMKHAEELIERILYLEGMPNMQRLYGVKVGETVPEQLQAELDTAQDAIARPAGPLGAFVLGLALGNSGGGIDDLRRLARRLADLADTWEADPSPS